MTGRRLVARGVLLAALLAPMPAAAEGPTLQGRVVTPDGATTIKNLPVIVRGEKRTVVTTTDEDGKYVVHQLPPGAYEVVPANEPELRRKIEIESTRRIWEVWKRDSGKPVTVDDIHLSTGKKY